MEIDYFGNYAVDSLFILGNIFILSDGSPIDKTCHLILQRALDDSIELKEKDIKGFIFRESLYQLLQPVQDEKPHTYDTVSIGNLNQVARETYGIYVKNVYKGDIIYSGDELRPFLSCMNNRNYGSSVVGGRDAAMIILQKGQSIRNTGFIKQFKMHYENFEEDEDTSGYQLELGNKLVLIIDI